MSDQVSFLTALGQALAAHTLYAAGHPSRGRAVAGAWRALGTLLSDRDVMSLSFLDGEVVCDGRVLRELRDWEWARRFAAVGMERLEFVDPVSEDSMREFVAFAHETIYPAEPRQGSTRPQGGVGLGGVKDGSIRWGRVSLAGEDIGEFADGSVEVATDYSLEEEVAGLGWIQDQAGRGRLPVAEVTTVVRSLAVAMRQEGRLVLPMLDLARYDQMAVTHACNVSVLAMGVAEFLGLASREVRTIGVAAMMHDIGKVMLPAEIVNKEGVYTAQDRAVMERHTIEGARLILERHRHMDLAAVVAYEHHLRLDGTGYPALLYPREPHFVSRIVMVCETYDAYCTNWPHVPALPPEEALSRIEVESGRSFDPAVVTAFQTMMRESRTARASADRPVFTLQARIPEPGT